MRVFQTGNPPASNDAAVLASYTNWPVTDCVSGEYLPIDSTYTNGNMAWPINCWFFVWANRVAVNGGALPPNPLQNPAIINPATGLECRVNYSTVALANAATQAIIRYWLGYPKTTTTGGGYLDVWTAAGGSATKVYPFTRLALYPGQYFKSTFNVSGVHPISYNVMTDALWLPAAPPSEPSPALRLIRANVMRKARKRNPAPGIVLDYECGDGRSAASTTSFLAALSADIHATSNTGGAAQLMLFTDPLNAASMPHSGLDATNLPTILQNYVDYMSIMLWARNAEGNLAASYQNQIDMLAGGNLGGVCSLAVPYGKLFITFDQQITNASDIQFVHNLLAQGASTAIKTAPAIVWFWNDGVANCTTPANSVMSGVLQGNGAAPTSLFGYTGTRIC